MNKLALLTIATVSSLVWQSAGCVVEADRNHHGDGGGGGGGGEVATISARWSMRNMVDGTTSPCPTGFDTVQLFAQAIDANGDPIDQPAVDIFDCNALRGTATDLFPDVYQVWIEVRSRDLKSLYAQSLSQILDTRDADQTFSTDVLKDGGYFQLSWDLIGKATNRPVSCEQAGSAATIKAVSASVADSAHAYNDEFVCTDHTAVSLGLLQGTYTISLDAMAGNKSIGKATTLTSKVIAGQNKVTDLGTIVIPIDGL